MNDSTDDQAPDALIVVGTHCPHCPSVLAALTEMLKAGEIGRLEAINLEARPDRAAELRVRSVPWMRIGGFILTGLHSKAELQQWVQRSRSVEGQAEYLEEMLGSGQLQEASRFVQQAPGSIRALLALLADPEQKINVKAGLGVLFEELEGSELLAQSVAALGELLDSESPEVRADVCHYLALSHAPEAKKYLERCLDDASADVREIARDGLETLAQ